MTIEVYSFRADCEADIWLLAELLKTTTAAGGRVKAKEVYGAWLCEFWPYEHVSMNTMFNTIAMMPEPSTMMQTICGCPIDANPRSASME